MNEPEMKDVSDIDCAKYVKYCIDNGIEARLATKDEDMINKFDMVIDGHNIDLKRINHPYCEIMKLMSPNNKAEYIHMIIDNNLSKTYLIKKQALVKTCAEYTKLLSELDFDEAPQKNEHRNPNVHYWIGPKSGDTLADFSFEMLDKNDYEIIDLSKILS